MSSIIGEMRTKLLQLPTSGQSKEDPRADGTHDLAKAHRAFLQVQSTAAAAPHNAFGGDGNDGEDDADGDDEDGDPTSCTKTSASKSKGKRRSGATRMT